MNKQAAGFTLIELIVVVVMIGILSAIAVPRFVDLSGSAKAAAVEGIAGGLASGGSINHALNISNDAGLTTTAPVTINTCDDMAGLLDGGLDSDYYLITTAGTTVSGGGIATEGGVSTCRVSYDSNNNAAYDTADTPFAEFTAYGVQ